MDSKFFFYTFAILVLALTFVQGTLGGIVCENLDEKTCAFAVSGNRRRCVLEKKVKRSGKEAYTCGTSEIEADKLKDLVETDQCVNACGLDRKTLGISSDSLLETLFAQKLCSPQCYSNCPNVVDLFFNLAAGEGVFLPKLCEAQGDKVRREISEIRSSGIAPPGRFFAVAADTPVAQPPEYFVIAADTPVAQPPEGFVDAADTPVAQPPECF